jgi:hypothetical protein
MMANTDYRLTDEQVSELLKLTGAADSVELKLTIPHAEQRATINALEIDPLDAQMRQVVFFDTPDLTLDKHGVVVRARRSQGKTDDSVVKLRPVAPDKISADLRENANFVVEVDAMPGGFVCSGSFKGAPVSADVRQVLGGERPVRKLFNKQQRAFFATHAPDGIELDGLSALGPITVLKVKFAPTGLARRMVAELWFYPDGERILELSTKCSPGEAFQVSAETRAFLHDRGIEVSAGHQQTKTRTALEYFSSELTATAAPEPAAESSLLPPPEQAPEPAPTG